MTAPGDSTLLLSLLLLFIASTGYAGGRIHQWYRMGRDRDEAFRDGYDTATRSVFSMAARVINPRRGDRSAIRASAAVVLPASAVVSTVVPTTEPAALTGSDPVTPATRSSKTPPSGSEQSSAARSSRHRPSATAATASPAATDAPSPADTIESSGRHTVPDELVRAATYRLPADRVARAKVPGGPSVEPPPADPAPWASVPKPRSS